MHYGTSTSLSPEKVMAKAVEYFGSLGLRTKRRSASTLTMVSDAGTVAISLSLGSETEVDIVVHGYNKEVKAFLQRIG